MPVLVRVILAVLGVLALSAVSYGLNAITGLKGWSWLIVTVVFAVVAVPMATRRRSH